MEYISFIGIVVLAHFLALVSPGPDFIMAIRNSLTYSRRTGIFTAVGFSLGIAVHIAYCLAGIAVIISQSIFIFNTLKIIGALYLIYIGVKSLRTKSTGLFIEKQKKEQDISALKAVKMGFLTNVLNPKATLFFLSLFTLGISSDTSFFIVLVASIFMVINTVIWFSLIALFFTQKRIQVLFGKFEGVFNKVFGSLLVLLGIKLLFHKSN